MVQNEFGRLIYFNEVVLVILTSTTLVL